jgi:hypothetical protein
MLQTLGLWATLPTTILNIKPQLRLAGVDGGEFTALTTPRATTVHFQELTIQPHASEAWNEVNNTMKKKSPSFVIIESNKGCSYKSSRANTNAFHTTIKPLSSVGSGVPKNASEEGMPASPPKLLYQNQNSIGKTNVMQNRPASAPLCRRKNDNKLDGEVGSNGGTACLVDTLSTCLYRTTITPPPPSLHPDL